MEHLIDLLDWKALAAVSGVFGFAPRAVLRIVVLAWPSDHPRRQELLGELGAIDYWKRPIWLAEQLETAIFDGLHQRVRRRRVHRLAPGRAPNEPEDRDEAAEWDDATFVAIFCS
ncbi:MAG: hypothetical protein LC808_05920 [Actinobacteria bacterium]|nr:hypothetical protein [Actinomycetota bacterium]